MKRICLVFLYLLWLQNSVAQELSDSSIMVVAHRGAHNHYPENSTSSIRKAVEIGVDMVEIDIRHTKDDALVLMHDKTIDRTTNGSGSVEDFTLDELKQFRLKNPDGSISDEQIPVFNTILEEFNGKILFDLDIKTEKWMQVVETVEKAQAFRSCMFLEDDFDTALSLKKRNKDVQILMIPQDENSLNRILNRIQPTAIHLNDKLNTAAINNIIHRHGCKSFINTLWNLDKKVIDDPDAFQGIYKDGANMIQTDYPEILLEHLRSRKLHK